ncbi:AfsR/SARP family transcriptional regulator [Streptomyces pratensis]|uniref:AfsR/SARP family transcriptional regulator n=1 Tax=Streptomyces pratensis TaxID=1169025 RepID=UPI001EE4C807|nr:AfsR/SARP family transcriptional regulator [Streptomyces pratensis]
MEIKLLGTLAAHLGETDWTPSAAKHRQVLALLALRAGHTVQMWELVDELWGDSPPRSAQATLQTYMMQLRRAITAAGGKFGAECRAKEILATTHGGYVLNVGSGWVDALEYENLASAGMAAARRGDHPQASELLNRAIGMWRGNALSDVCPGSPLKVEMLRLEESRLSVFETCVAVDLTSGHTTEVLSRLTELTARYPLHERFHLQLMMAQYRAGRLWQALETYRRLHTRLVTELGLEPSEAVRDAHQRMLRRDATLTLDAAGTGSGGAHPGFPFGQLRSA